MTFEFFSNTAWTLYSVLFFVFDNLDVSIFELVRDPWLPVVYVGIVMMMLGAVGLFVNAQRKRAGNGNVE